MNNAERIIEYGILIFLPYAELFNWTIQGYNCGSYDWTSYFEFLQLNKKYATTS